MRQRISIPLVPLVGANAGVSVFCTAYQRLAVSRLFVSSFQNTADCNTDAQSPYRLTLSCGGLLQTLTDRGLNAPLAARCGDEGRQDANPDQGSSLSCPSAARAATGACNALQCPARTAGMAWPLERWGHWGRGPANARPPEQPECMERCDTSSVAAQRSWAIRENMPIVPRCWPPSPAVSCVVLMPCARDSGHTNASPASPVVRTESTCTGGTESFRALSPPSLGRCAASGAKSPAQELLTVLILLLGSRI